MPSLPPNSEIPRNGSSGTEAAPGSRPEGGQGTRLRMLTAKWPSHISIIQSRRSYPEDHSSAFVFNFFFGFVFLINYLPCVIRLNYAWYLLEDKERSLLHNAKVAHLLSFMSSRVEVFSNVTSRFWVCIG